MKHARAACRLELRLLDTKARTAEASLSSDTPVRVGGELEVLSHEPDAVDLSRAAAGLPLLFAHDQSMPIGLVENVRLEGGRLTGTLRFGSSAKALEVWQDVSDGLMLYMSVGYRVLAPVVPMEGGGYLVPKWMPYEASVVSVPMDPTVGINRAHKLEGIEVPQKLEVASGESAASVASGGAAVDQVRGLVRLAGLSADFAAGLVARSLSLDAVRSAIFDELARRSNDSGPLRSAAALPEYNSEGVGIHSPEGRVAAFAEVLAARCGGPAPGEASRQFMGLRCVDMARELLELRGLRTTSMSNSQIIERALHGTSDFSSLLTGAGERVLRKSYDTYKGGLRRVCRASTARDFRPKQALALSEAPVLEKVNQHGEFKRTSKMADTVSTYRLDTFGKIFGITRQALVNDDLDAFGQMNAKFGIAAAEFEALQLVKLLTSNPTMGDGLALFHANHKNLGTAQPLEPAALSEGRYKMRMQTGIDGVTPIDASARYLVIPAALEAKLDQLLTAYNATTWTENLGFNGLWEKVVDPRLDAISATDWYMAADPAVIDTIEYAYLEEQPGPQFSSREGFDVDGLELKVHLDFGCGVMDHRGLFKGRTV